jgi:hypothetical protein
MFYNEKTSSCYKCRNPYVIYFTHFQSVFKYWIIFWGSSTNINEVFLLQKRISGMVGIGPRCSCRWFRKLNIWTVPCLYILSLMTFVVKNHNNFLICDINTSHGDHLNRPVVNLSVIQKWVTYSSVRVFNSLPSSILKLQHGKLLFKNALKEYLSSHDFIVLMNSLNQLRSFINVSFNITLTKSSLVCVLYRDK